MTDASAEWPRREALIDEIPNERGTGPALRLRAGGQGLVLSAIDADGQCLPHEVKL